MRVKITPRRIFLIISLFLTAIIGLFSYFIAKQQFETYVVDAHGKNLQAYINNIASEYFDFSITGSLTKSGNPIEYITGLKKNENLTAIKLTDANGSVIASTKSSDLNLGLLENESWRTAINGQYQVEHLNEATATATFYLPLISQNDVVRGVVITEATLPDGYSTINQFTNTILYTILGTLGLFVAISYLLMYELEEKMEEKERSIFDQSKAQTEEKQLYEAITSSIAESLVVINKNKQIMMINPEAERFIGHKSSEVEYRSYEKIINFYDENGKLIKKDPIDTALRGGEIVHISSKDAYFIKNQAGNTVPVAVNIAPIIEGKSFIKGVALTIIDISTEKELQKVKDEFVYVVAHELGNPIFAMDGYLSLIGDHGKSLGKQKNDLLKNAQSINRQLSSLVNDLLEVARNETGRLTFELEKIDLSSLIAETIKNSEFKARDKKVKIIYKGDRLPKTIGNERKIGEVLTNLIDNAIKYTPAGGKIEIDTFTENKQAIVSIKDSGIGLSDENKKHLFEKFFRVKNKATEGISGTGLGLFIAKQIVEKCGGKIWASSEEGKGSTFNFALKIAK